MPDQTNTVLLLVPLRRQRASQRLGPTETWKSAGIVGFGPRPQSRILANTPSGLGVGRDEV